MIHSIHEHKTIIIDNFYILIAMTLKISDTLPVFMEDCYKNRLTTGPPAIPPTIQIKSRLF